MTEPTNAAELLAAPPETTNAERAERAYRVLLSYAQHVGDDLDAHSLGTWITDLIGDLGHLAAEYDEDARELADTGLMHYESEAAAAELYAALPE